ncbi:ABC transporter permease [Colwellia sp. TT2012]|uniref:ABC transporter permease n=1 Tax=Colwellia sp. TT2012 TaxID=1720342 RepID=UPI00070D936E|nr:ABC transporter permease [Colwellia sp. TT2012]
MNASIRQFNALLIKELKEAYRDKRALMVALSMAFFLPVLMVIVVNIVITKSVDNPAVYVQFTGAEYAPKLIKALQDKNILAFADVPSEDKRQWQQQSIELKIPESYAQDMAEGRPIDIILRADFTEQSLGVPLRRIDNIIQKHSMAIGYKRLLVRGIDTKLLQPIALQKQDTALPSSNAMMISMMLGISLLLLAFMSGLSIAIDSSAGERERNILEMLLCQPVSTLKIVLAKMTCVSSVSILSIAIMLSLTSFAMNFIDLSKLGMSFNIDLTTFSVLMLLLIPICFLAAILQLFFAFQAKSFKEAQATVSMLIAVPTTIPYAMMFMDSKPAWLSYAPIAGHSLLMEDIFKGLPIDWFAFAATTALTLALIAALVVTLSIRLKSEKVVMALS